MSPKATMIGLRRTEFERSDRRAAEGRHRGAPATYLALFMNATDRDTLTLRFTACGLNGSANDAIPPFAVQNANLEAQPFILAAAIAQQSARARSRSPNHLDVQSPASPP